MQSYAVKAFSGYCGRSAYVRYWPDVEWSSIFIVVDLLTKVHIISISIILITIRYMCEPINLHNLHCVW